MAINDDDLGIEIDPAQLWLTIATVRPTFPYVVAESMANWLNRAPRNGNLCLGVYDDGKRFNYHVGMASAADEMRVMAGGKLCPLTDELLDCLEHSGSAQDYDFIRKRFPWEAAS